MGVASVSHAHTNGTSQDDLGIVEEKKESTIIPLEGYHYLTGATLMCGTCQTKKLKGASSGMNVDYFFSSTIPKSSCDVICCSPVLPISFIPFPSQIQLGGLCKCNELPDVCWQSLHARGFLQRLAYILSYVLRCTSAIRYKALTPEKMTASCRSWKDRIHLVQLGLHDLQSWSGRIPRVP